MSTTMSPEELAGVLQYAISIAHKAGQMIRDGQARRFSTSATQDSKLNSVDLVTEVDRAVESFLIESIRSRYPTHDFVGEETYEGQEIQDGPTWIVDPIDGTTNFVHGFPMVACSIGFTLGRRPVVGVVYNPFLDLMYYGSLNAGSYLHTNASHPPTSATSSTQRLPLFRPARPIPSLQTALIGIEWGSSRSPPVINLKSSAYLKLAADGKDVPGGKMVHSLRSLGSAALNTCLVACGSMDLYWEIGCWPWDVCAGMIILHEAGGLSFGSKHSPGPMNGEMTPEILIGRKYTFVRGMDGDAGPEGEGEKEEKGGKTGKEYQMGLVKEFFDCVEEYDP